MHAATLKVFNPLPQYIEFTRIEQINAYYRVFTTQGVKTDNAIYRLHHRKNRQDEQRRQLAMMDNRLRKQAARPIETGSIISFK